MGRIMSKQTENEDNFKKYQQRLVRLQQEGQLSPPPDLPIDQLICYLANEGMKLLEAEAKAKKPNPTAPPPNEISKLNTTLAANDKNPFIRARALVLSKMSAAKKKEIVEMEKSGNVNNATYDKFVADIVKVGNELENGK